MRPIDQHEATAARVPAPRASDRTAIIVMMGLLASACGGTSTPSAPTPTPQVAAPVVLAVQSMRTTPAGVGVLYNTDYQFEAVGTFPAGTQFTWQFGDSTSTTTSTPTSTHVYAQTGNFGVTVEARSASNSAAATGQVTIGSMVGRWRGTVTGNTVYPPQRPIPITSFDLTINNAPRPSSAVGSVSLSASWADDAGCRRDRLIVQSFNPRPTSEVSISIESLPCSDGDFSMSGTADARFTVVEGTCRNAGPNCRFRMTRQ